MRHRALFAFLALTLAACGPMQVVNHFRRQSYYESFVGKHSSVVLDEFGTPDDGNVVGDSGYLTYYLPLGNGVNRKVVFAVNPDATVRAVNYWPK